MVIDSISSHISYVLIKNMSEPLRFIDVIVNTYQFAPYDRANRKKQSYYSRQTILCPRSFYWPKLKGYGYIKRQNFEIKYYRSQALKL